MREDFAELSSKERQALWRHERFMMLCSFYGFAAKIDCCADCRAKIERAIEEAMTLVGYGNKLKGSVKLKEAKQLGDNR